MFDFVGQALVGWLVADLLGGFVHWWQDRIGKPQWKWLDKWVFGPNRLHHDEPRAFTNSGFWQRNSTTIAAATAAAIIWLALTGPSIVLLFAFIGGALQSQIHYWQHSPTSEWIKVFQRIGIIQGPQQHSKHHYQGADKYYCILTAWLNPVLEKLSFWNRLEKLFGIAKP